MDSTSVQVLALALKPRVGDDALSANTSGSNNVAIGVRVLEDNRQALQHCLGVQAHRDEHRRTNNTEWVQTV